MKNILLSILVAGCCISIIPTRCRTINDAANRSLRDSCYEQQCVAVIDIETLIPYEGKLYEELDFKYSYVKGIEDERLSISGWEFFKIDKSRNILVVNRYTQTVLLYDFVNKKIRRIGIEGDNSDKGEYLKLSYSDFRNNEVLVLNSTSGRIFKYNYNGYFKGFIDSDKIIASNDIRRINNQFLNDVIYLNDNREILIHYPWWVGESKSKFLILDSNSNIVAEKNILQGFNGITETYFSRSAFNSYEYNNAMHIVSLTDTVYKISKSNFLPKYFFKQKYSINKLVDSLGSMVDIYNIGNLPVYEFKVVETDSYLIFKYININLPPYGEREVRYGMYDKATGKSYSLSQENFSFHTKDSIPILKILFGHRIDNDFYTTVKTKKSDSYDIVKVSLLNPSVL